MCGLCALVLLRYMSHMLPARCNPPKRRVPPHPCGHERCVNQPECFRLPAVCCKTPWRNVTCMHFRGVRSRVVPEQQTLELL